MKKESKGRYKVSEQLSSKTSALIMIASGVSVLLLMIYFGVSLTAKGTFSAESFYTCANGVLSEFGAAHMCCPSDYPTLGRVVTTDTLYPLSSGGYLCQNSNYNSNAIRTGTIGSCLSTQYNDPMTGTVDCPAAGGTYVAGTGCYLPCATAPLGQASYVSCDYSYVGAPSNGVMTISNPNSGCECPSGWTKNGNNCTTTVSNGTNSTYYARGGMDSCYTAGGYEYAADGNCRKCDSGYVFTNSSNNTCIDEDLPNSSDDPRCTWGDYNESLHRCEVTCNVSVVSNPTKTSCENEFNGYTCEEQASNIFICYGGMPTCNVTINDCILEGDIIDGRVDATLTMTTPVTYKYKWEFSGAGYAGGVPSEFQANWQSVPVIPKRIDVFTVKTNESGPITATITVLLSTGATCTDTRNLTVTPCTDCGSGGGGVENRCIKGTGEIVAIDLSTCDEYVAGTTCQSDPTANANKYCTVNNSSRRVKRCDLTMPNASNCAPATETITCYRCTADSTTVSEEEFDGNSCPSGWSTTRPSTCAKSCKYCSNDAVQTVNNIPKEKACSAVNSSYHETSETLDCTEAKKTCYKCTADSTTVSEQEVNQSANCPSGWSTTRPSTCAKSCNYCEDNTKKTDNNVPKEKACSAYSSNYYETSETLDCSGQKKTCYKCNSETTTPDTEQVDQNASCRSGWSTTRPSCSKSCNYCENNTKKTDDNVPKGKTCSAYNSNYHETSENLDCSPATKTCYYCEGESRKSFTLEASANGNCANSTAHPGASSDSKLVCVEEVKCCACDGSTKVTKGNSTNKVCPSGQTVCSELVCTNVQTGTGAIVIAWIVGIMAIGYSFYYFRKTNKQQ